MCRQWECSLGHSRLVGPVYHSPAHGLSLAAVRRLTQYHKPRYVSHIRACAEIYRWRVQACAGQYTARHLSGSYPGRVQACTRQVYGSRTPGNVRILGISGRVYGSIRPGNVGFCPVVALGRHTQLCKVPGLSPYVTHRAGNDAKTDFCSVPLACFLCVRYI
ncbi:hypothetical protein Bbelb_133080 [Branchiostoma belcheri]|nr:hypothetical protein Bbelb_133080 [Branchiostoma belcheri]